MRQKMKGVSKEKGGNRPMRTGPTEKMSNFTDFKACPSISRQKMIRDSKKPGNRPIRTGPTEKMSSFLDFRACPAISRAKMWRDSKKRVTRTDERTPHPHGGAVTSVVDFYTSQTELEERNASWGQIDNRARGEELSSNPEEPPVKPTKRPTKLRRSKRIAALKQRKKAREAPAPTRRSARIAARNASSV